MKRILVAMLTLGFVFTVPTMVGAQASQPDGDWVGEPYYDDRKTFNYFSADPIYEEYYSFSRGAIYHGYWVFTGDYVDIPQGAAYAYEARMYNKDQFPVIPSPS